MCWSVSNQLGQLELPLLFLASGCIYSAWQQLRGQVSCCTILIYKPSTVPLKGASALFAETRVSKRFAKTFPNRQVLQPRASGLSKALRHASPRRIDGTDDDRYNCAARWHQTKPKVDCRTLCTVPISLDGNSISTSKMPSIFVLFTTGSPRYSSRAAAT